METNAQHYTNASCHKENIPLEKICGTSDKPQQPKKPREKKQKTSRKPKKKTKKKTMVSGKGFGGHFSQIPWFFWFFWFLWFLWFFCFFWFSRVFFVFFWFSWFFFLCFLVFWIFRRFPRSVFRFASIWIVHSRCCADCTFSTELCARCPTACLSYFFQSKQLFYIPSTWQMFAWVIWINAYCILLSHQEDNCQSINVHYLNIQHYFKQNVFHLIFFFPIFSLINLNRYFFP